MNRRDLIRTLLGTAAASGVAMTATVVDAIPASPAPFLLFLTATVQISASTADRLRKHMETALSGTAFAHVRVIVLGGEITVKAIGLDGRELTYPVDVKPRKPRARRPRQAGEA